jgi:hypothetical protein
LFRLHAFRLNFAQFIFSFHFILRRYINISGGTLLVTQWLRHRATNLKVAGSIPDGVTGIFH